MKPFRGGKLSRAKVAAPDEEVLPSAVSGRSIYHPTCTAVWARPNAVVDARLPCTASEVCGVADGSVMHVGFGQFQSAIVMNWPRRPRIYLGRPLRNEGTMGIP